MKQFDYKYVDLFILFEPNDMGLLLPVESGSAEINSLRTR
jgi:hypothetical protein